MGSGKKRSILLLFLLCNKYKAITLAKQSMHYLHDGIIKNIAYIRKLQINIDCTKKVEKNLYNQNKYYICSHITA